MKVSWIEYNFQKSNTDLNSVRIGGSCLMNALEDGPRSCNVEVESDWRMNFSFSESSACGRFDSGKPSAEEKMNEWFSMNGDQIVNVIS